MVRIAATLLLGAAAGWALQRLGAPLPWMLGSTAACAIAAIFGLPLAMPPGIRPVALPLLGVMMGTNFAPDILGHALGYLASLAIMFALMIAAAIAGTAYYRRMAGFDRPTSYFCAMPGGLVDMALLGEEAGGDVRAISLVHAARIFVIVAIVPFVVQAAEHVSLGPRQATPVSVFDANAMTYVWVVGVAVAGYGLGTILHLPAKYMLGPLIVSAAVHGAGLTDFIIPREIVNGAQVILGCATGCRFVGFARRHVLTTLGHAFVFNGILIAITCLTAWFVAPLTPVGFSSVLLAFAAGGLSEMGLVALALHLDVAFVLVHQLIRVAAVIAIAPLAYRRLTRKLHGAGHDG